MSRTRIPTQQDIRDQGRCGHGYRPSDGNHCGKPSEPGAPFGDCPDHAREFREQGRDIDRADRGYQSARRIELGDRVVDAQRWENLGLRHPAEWPAPLVRKGAVVRRARDAQAPPARTRGRSR